MQDRTNQIVLGCFLSAFLFSLEVLRNVDSIAERSFVPRLSLFIAFMLVLVSIAALIVFFDRIANSLNAENVIRLAYAQLDKAIKDLRKSQPEESCPIDVELPTAWPFRIVAIESGYVRFIDYELLQSAAKQYRTVINMKLRAGQYIIRGELLGVASTIPSQDSIDVKSSENQDFVGLVRESLAIGSIRTEEQDLEYSFRQLVEIALRALSPGINDPFTAISCLDWLASALEKVLRLEPATTRYFDEDGQLRVVAEQIDIRGLLDVSFSEIRQNSRGHISVLIRLVEILTTIAVLFPEKELDDELLSHGRAVRESIDLSLIYQNDLARLDARILELKSATGSNQETQSTAPLT